jgi:hypothetical protein
VVVYGSSFARRQIQLPDRPGEWMPWTRFALEYNRFVARTTALVEAGYRCAPSEAVRRALEEGGALLDPEWDPARAAPAAPAYDSYEPLGGWDAPPSPAYSPTHPVYQPAEYDPERPSFAPAEHVPETPPYAPSSPPPE